MQVRGGICAHVRTPCCCLQAQLLQGACRSRSNGNTTVEPCASRNLSHWEGNLGERAVFPNNAGAVAFAQANELASRVKAVSRRILSATGEVAMIRVVSGELGTKHQSLAETLATATARLEAGEAPTDDADQEWDQRMELDCAHATHQQQEVRRHREGLQTPIACAVLITLLHATRKHSRWSGQPLDA